MRRLEIVQDHKLPKKMTKWNNLWMKLLLLLLLLLATKTTKT